MKTYFLITQEAIKTFNAEMHPGLARLDFNPFLICDAEKDNLGEFIVSLLQYDDYRLVSEADYHAYKFFKTASIEDIQNKFK